MPISYNYINSLFIESSGTQLSNRLSRKEISDIKSITSTFSAKDRRLLNLKSGEKHNPTGYKCFIQYSESVPVAYVIIDKDDKNIGDISFGVRSDYRGKGFAKQVIDKAIHYINSHSNEFKEIYWATKPDNIASQKLAEYFGFKLVRDDKDWKTYVKKCNKTITESKDISELDNNHKTKDKVTYKIVEFDKDIANKYLNKLFSRDALDFNIKSKMGEIAITPNGNLIGYVLINKSGTIGPLYVDEKHRGQGFGDLLLKDAVNKYNGNKLGVFKDNKIAIELYKKNGFKITKEDKDRIFMAKE